MNISQRRVLGGALMSTVLTVATLTAAPAHAALGDCPSGYLCIWSGTSYGGKMQKFNSTDTYRPITLSSTNSYYNHRSYRSYLHATTDGSGSYVCIAPDAKKTATSGWQTSAKAAYLSAVLVTC